MTKEIDQRNEVILVDNVSKSYEIYKRKRDYLKQILNKNKRSPRKYTERYIITVMH